MAKLTESVREGAHVLLEKAGDLQERIRKHAHAIWEREGRPQDRDQDHWNEAEKEVATEKAAAAKTKSPSSKPRRVKREVEAATPPKRGGAKKSAPLADAATAAEVAAAKTVEHRTPTKSRRATAKSAKSHAAPKDS